MMLWPDIPLPPTSWTNQRYRKVRCGQDQVMGDGSFFHVMAGYSSLQSYNFGCQDYERNEFHYGWTHSNGRVGRCDHAEFSVEGKGEGKGEGEGEREGKLWQEGVFNLVRVPQSNALNLSKLFGKSVTALKKRKEKSVTALTQYQRTQHRAMILVRTERSVRILINLFFVFQSWGRGTENKSRAISIRGL